MLLLECHHVTRTHRAAVMLPANARADATFRCRRETVLVVGILEVSFNLWWIPVGAEPQILVDTIRINELAGIHLPLRIPDGLKLPKRFDHFRVEHSRQQFTTRLSVTVFARK